ncbi:hypothetical protein B0A48_09856 [Cryoendolithus antarcticus]|uniref:SHSP domain-containing protein n=1 Tax=Cryoendolithus antarcticus TaxID=1507870 RepID=A0A1V8T3L4_9PEZI|nr:hypothetical protein B0A48_09856 [Cryoendolithus antarcticus]
MPPPRYVNQMAPFWDFIAELDPQAANHAFGGERSNNDNNDNDTQDQANPWANGFNGWPFGAMPNRGRFQGPQPPHGPQHDGEHPPPPPHHGEGPPPPPGPPHHGEAPPPPPPPGHEGSPAPPLPPGAPHHGPPHHPHGPPPFHHGGRGSRGRCGGQGRGRGWGASPWAQNFAARSNGEIPPFLANLAEMFQSQLFDNQNGNEFGLSTNKDKSVEKSGDFRPEADIFATDSAWVIHLSLPGAKKEDIAVDWDAEASTLNISGVVYRPGDEDFLKTLAHDERAVGAFERKLTLGSATHPAKVDIDGISAKLEDGVLRVTVPKEEKEWVDVKRVDIE